MNLTENIRVFNCGYLALMKNMPDNFTDVAVLDPEYGIGESSKNHKSRNTPVKQKNGKKLQPKSSSYNKKDWDSKPPDDIFFSEVKRVSINQVIFGANYFTQIVGETFKPPRRENYNDFIKKHPTGWIIWDKVNGSNDFSDCELIYTTFNFSTFVVYYMWNGMMQGEEVSTDLNKAKIQIGNKQLNEKRQHPTQKPVKIYKWLFYFFNLFGQSILDTNLGLFSIVMAAHDANCTLYGCDIDEEYFDKGIKRVEPYLRQKSLFNP